MAITNLNITELKDFLNHIISNNRYLQNKTKPMLPVAVEVIGESGIGKTSTIIQIADELGLDFVKLNLAQIEELGDLIGFPKEEFQVYKVVTQQDKAQLNFTKLKVGQKAAQWVDKVALTKYLDAGYQMTGKSRMSYSAPEWISNKKSGGILLLDDWNRADQRFIQAVMELVDRQEYVSWKLPKDWHIILTANPDNGDYSVNSIDSAQKTRFISANLQFDADVWAKWAEQMEVDSRCINFLIMNPELVTQETNARSITKFFSSIESLQDFESSLPTIQMIGDGSVGDAFSSMFVTFINNKLDKLVSPQEMLTDEDTVLKKLKSCMIVNGIKRADIASTLANRLINFALYYAEDNTISGKIIDRLKELICGEYFDIDLRYLIVRSLHAGNKKKFAKLLMYPEVIKYTLASE